ncbi:hypothetical protein [Amycolatopsis australiensis]|uniref:Uncharacterized protein n=1 Tax=Amycolatopsis australiensis TaxID=546364 RepID=A0A1K1PSC8_9PSEU|nr:hypothetical protein [Amycolatopsis australiensis]SFW50404.1 hypothetical protein SAMN04489730_0945 [Amycolatopsis australiensis]
MNPETNPTEDAGTDGRPRVWLVAGLAAPTREPADHPPVRDDLMRRWEPRPDGTYQTADGRHHASWTELHARYDLVEVA